MQANIPLGTRMNVVSLQGHVIAKCVVESITKSGNIVLRAIIGGKRFKTKYHFQKTSLFFSKDIPQKFELTATKFWRAQIA